MEKFFDYLAGEEVNLLAPPACQERIARFVRQYEVGNVNEQELYEAVRTELALAAPQLVAGLPVPEGLTGPV